MEQPIEKRKISKPPYVSPGLIEKIKKAKMQGGKFIEIKTKSRSSTIIGDFLNITIHVHNGKIYIPVYINESKIGHKLGEFSFTRTFRSHKVDKVKIVKKITDNKTKPIKKAGK